MLTRGRSRIGWIYFNLRWFDESIDEFRVSSTPAASIGNGFLGINWYELRQVAGHSNNTWEMFCELDPMSRAGCIAFYRNENKVAALISDWQSEQMKTASKGKK